ncbi:uncharacterized protein K441DRAFT_677227 [Cenococcum geophilum 1.58]|uniref:uncharacterized protein n=1 Tax=Cenococcum geophilum 1.58 TaxID=794803 RepID=UPI00358DF5DC|nr:hypothetical protein K441DRAFT_677227 [Cenococcum geophilum 1.58]
MSHWTKIQALLALTALTGMLKYMAKLKDHRIAHDKLGRVNASSGIEQYMTVQWDRLTLFPATWNLRFNGEGRGVYKGPDNADQGHSINKVYQNLTQIPAGGPYRFGS